MATGALSFGVFDTPISVWACLFLIVPFGTTIMSYVTAFHYMTIFPLSLLNLSSFFNDSPQMPPAFMYSIVPFKKMQYCMMAHAVFSCGLFSFHCGVTFCS